MLEVVFTLLFDDDDVLEVDGLVVLLEDDDELEDEDDVLEVEELVVLLEDDDALEEVEVDACDHASLLPSCSNHV